LLYVLALNSSFLYMSAHDYQNLYSFDSVDGTVATKSLLNVSSLNKSNLDFRGVNVYNNGLYVANGYDQYSFVARWVCNNATTSRATTLGLTFMNIFTNYSVSVNPGLVHPYDIFWSASKNAMLASAQDTNSALIYTANGQPYPNLT